MNVALDWSMAAQKYQDSMFRKYIAIYHVDKRIFKIVCKTLGTSMD